MTRIPPEIREAVIRRAAHACEYCRLPQASQVATFHVDHVLPRARGGATTSDNLALACPQCNAKKSSHVEAVDPETRQVVPLFNPRTGIWTEHFRWFEDDRAILLGLSPSGRATIELLELNSSRRVAIRRKMMEAGTHPPAGGTL